MYHGRSGDSYEGSFSPGGVHSHSHSTPKSKGPIKKSVVVSFQIISHFMVLALHFILHFYFNCDTNRLKYILKSSLTFK